MGNPLIRIFILLASFAVIVAAQAAFGADEAAGNNKELRRIKKEMQEKKRELKREGRRERRVLADIDKLDRAIQTGSADLAAQEKRLRDAEESLRGIESDSGTLRSSLNGLMSVYRKRVRALYKTGRLRYAVALLASDGPGSALKRAKYLGIIIERDRAVIEDYRGALERLAKKQVETEKAKGEIIRRKRAVEAKRIELGIKRREKAELLAGVREKKDLYEESIRELEEASASLWALIKKAEKERKAAARKARLERKETTALSAGRGALPWPVSGQIITPYGMQRHPRFGTTVFRRGIEISARPGETVIAVYGGQAAFADWYKGYGKLVILDHGEGLYTLYGHLDAVKIVQSETVSRGQSIGVVGETGGVKETRLYFEVRKNGEAQDPLIWLSKR